MISGLAHKYNCGDTVSFYEGKNRRKKEKLFFLSPRWLVFILIFDVGGSRIPGQYAEVWKKKDFYLLCVFRRLY